MPARLFRSLFCERYDCAESNYEAVAFTKCLRWQARLLSPLVRRIDPDYFAVDIKFIRSLGTAAGLREVHNEVLDYSDAVKARPSLLRTGLNVRVSGRKALHLAKKLFEPA